MFDDCETVFEVVLFKHCAFDGVVRQAKLPRRIVEGIGKVGQAVLVHACVAQLTRKGKDEGAGAFIGGAHV